MRSMSKASLVKLSFDFKINFKTFLKKNESPIGRNRDENMFETGEDRDH